MTPFSGQTLNPQAFDDMIRKTTHDLADVLKAVIDTRSRQVESTHFLLVLANIASGRLARDLEVREITLEQWKNGLVQQIDADTAGIPPTRLVQDHFAPSASRMIEEAVRICEQRGVSQIDEPTLLLSGLKNLTPKVRQLLAMDAGIDLEAWRRQLETTINPPPEPVVFDSEGRVVEDVFSPGGRKVLRLLRTEAEALGHTKIDPRHLLLAMLGLEGGVTQYGLYLEGLSPNKVRESVMLSWRNRVSKNRSELTLSVDTLQPLLVYIFKEAAKGAARQGMPTIAEPHILKAFLDNESAALHLLRDQNVKLQRMAEATHAYDPETDIENEQQASLADSRMIREHLKARLVGQDDAIEQIVPYVELMQFGFSVPERPVGVFLFCGQSGSGKTEMAKALEHRLKVFDSVGSAGEADVFAIGLVGGA